MTIGMALRHLRRSAGISQGDLAGRLGISASYLSLIEADRREPSVPLLRRLAKALGAPAVLLFATALAGNADNPATADISTVLEKLVHAVGLHSSQTQIALD